VLPNLLLSFGLIGTFIGIATNLVSLSGIINSTEASNINELVAALKSPFEGMGIAFISSLAALFGSAFLVTANLFLNINTQKNDLLSGFENYLDNIINAGNLDSKIQDVAANKIPISTLKASSNADLGLMRALTVVKILKNIQSSSNHLKNVKFRAYSAGQLILPRDIESADPQDGRRRRI
jgi:hypothetical protein